MALGSKTSTTDRFFNHPVSRVNPVYRGTGSFGLTTRIQ